MFNWFRKETQLVLVTIEMVQEKLNLKNEVLKLKSELHEAHESIARLRTMHDKVYKENKGLKKSYPTFKSLLELGIDKTAELVNKELVEENETLRQAYQTLNPDVYCKNILDELSEEKLHNDRQTGLILNLEKKIQSLKDKHDTLEHWIKGLFDMVQYDKADKTPYKDAVQAMEFIRENYGDLLDCCTKQEETIAKLQKQAEQFEGLKSIFTRFIEADYSSKKNRCIYFIEDVCKQVYY